MSKFITLFENVMQDYDRAKVRGGSLAKIDPAALKIPEIKSRILATKGASYLAQLNKIAHDELILFVSALKTVRPGRADGIAETPSGNFEEADIVQQKVPGSYSSPMTVPLSILIPHRDPSEIMQEPFPDDLVYKPKTGTGVQDDSYNQGKQPKGTKEGK